jgi:hypothetical protein
MGNGTRSGILTSRRRTHRHADTYVYTYRHADTYVHVQIDILIHMNIFIFRHAYTNVYMYLSYRLIMFRHALYTYVYIYTYCVCVCVCVCMCVFCVCHVQGKRNMIWELLDDDAALDVGMHEFQFELKAMKLGRFRV